MGLKGGQCQCATWNGISLALSLPARENIVRPSLSMHLTELYKNRSLAVNYRLRRGLFPPAPPTSSSIESSTNPEWESGLYCVY